MLTAREPSVKPLADVVRCYICCDGQHKSGNTRHFSHLPSRIKWAGKAANPLYHTFRQKDTGDAKSRTFLQRKGSPSYNLSVSLRSTAPLVGEPLAKPFTLRGLPKPPLGRSNGDDRRQWRKQGGAVGAAASRMRAAAKQTLGAATRAVALRSNDGEVELLPLWGSWREAPERAHPRAVTPAA